MSAPLAPLAPLRTTLAAVATAALLAAAPEPAGAQDLRFVSLGSATLQGNYYAVARAIADRASEAGAPAIRFSPEPTPGSHYNLVALRQKEIEFALVQSDWQRQAVEGTGPFSDDGPMADLRSVMALYPEAVTVVARREEGLRSLEDLRGRVVDVGHPSTARRATNERVLAALGLGRSDFRRMAELSGNAVSAELCARRIDAALLTIGHPSDAIDSLLRSCDLTLLPIEADRIETLVAEVPEFTAQTIPASAYEALTGDIPTVGVTATVVTRADVPDDLVTLFTRVVLDRHRDLARVVPVLGTPDLDWMRSAGLTAPMHPAAAAAFDAPPAAE